jgi:ATP-dependent exoDNAse (exonuclease V) beta subunit
VRTERTSESDSQAREAIRNSLDETLIVEAAAGTGKTTELVNRIVAVIRAGRARVDQIVAVTFTHKAAGELKVRLRQVLDDARQSAEGVELDNLENALKRLEEAAIGTIHSFCGQLLRERPVEACIDPAFEELTEPEQRRLYGRAFQAWMERALAESRPGLRRALSRLTWQRERDQTPISRLQQAGLSLVEWRDFRQPWRREPFERRAAIEGLMSEIKLVADCSSLSKKPRDPLYRALASVRELAAWFALADAESLADLDTLEGRILELVRQLNREKRTGQGAYADTVSREQMIQARSYLIDKIAEFSRSADAELAALLQADMQDLIDGFQELKERSGRLDFTDLLLKVRNLLRDNATVRDFLQQRFTHIFIDEFQDTDPLQAEILILLSAVDPAASDWLTINPKPGKLFIVGDPKQAIYRFRRADVAIYLEVRDRLCKAPGVRLVQLSTSFRAPRDIQECVNAAFAPEMRESLEDGQTGYVPLEGGNDGIAGQPAIIALPVPRPTDRNGTIRKKNIDSSLPEATAAFVYWLLRESGWKVRDPDNPERLVAIQERHIAILFRRLLNYGQDVSASYTRSLEARNIPHLLVGSKSVHQREEIETLRSACTAIEWPDDELAVYATLRGSLFAIQDGVLLRYQHEAGRLNPLRAGTTSVSDELKLVTSALEVLAGLHRLRNQRPVAETVNLVLESTRAHIGFGLRPGGHQALANVLRIVEIARGYEQTGGISFRGFVEDLIARSERVDRSEAPMIEATAEGVRLLTVHAAKGLEYPIVILADMSCNIASQYAQRFLDPAKGICAQPLLNCEPFELSEHASQEQSREHSEGIRVAYVAATRARDLLVVPAVGTTQQDGWLSPLNKAIYPPIAGYRKCEPPVGCPPFRNSSMLDMGGSYQEGIEATVKPGLHAPSCGTHKVVWWDPAALVLHVPANLGLQSIDILTRKNAKSAEALHRWQSLRDEAIARGRRAEFEILIPSEIAESPEVADVNVQIEAAAVSAHRPHGRRFGTLVHAVLRDAALNREETAVLARAHGRAVGATPDEIVAALAAVEEALNHPLLQRARAATRRYRELPVTWRLDDNRVLDGVIDLAFVDDGEWHVIDFKTDADVAARRTQYERQLKWYAAALQKLTNQPARCYLLKV